MSGATGRKPRFEYAAIRESMNQARQRRMAGFEGLVIKARLGDPEPLIEHLQDVGPLLLSAEERNALGRLLERKLIAHLQIALSPTTGYAWLYHHGYIIEIERCYHRLEPLGSTCREPVIVTVVTRREFFQPQSHIGP